MGIKNLYSETILYVQIVKIAILSLVFEFLFLFFKKCNTSAVQFT